MVPKEHHSLIFLFVFGELAGKGPYKCAFLPRPFGLEGMAIEAFLPVYLILWGMYLLNITILVFMSDRMA